MPAKKVTDPNILKQFEARESARKVTDQRVLQEFEDREAARRAGADYDKIAGSYDAKRQKRATGSIFGDRKRLREGTGEGTIVGSLARGAIIDPAEGITQLIGRGANKLQRAVGLDPNAGIAGGEGIFSDRALEYNDARRRVQEGIREEARAARGRTGTDVARIVGSIAAPTPKVGAAGRVAASLAPRALRKVAEVGTRAALQGASGAATQAVEGDPDNFLAAKARQIGEGAAYGAGTGVALQGAGRALRRVAGRATSRSETGRIADAAQRLGVDVGVGQITPNRALRRLTDISGNAFGGGPIARASERTERQLGAAVDRVAGEIGTGQAGPQVGRTAVRAIDRTGGFRDRFRTASEALYHTVDSHAPAGNVVDMQNTTTAMTRVADAFRSNPALGQALNNPTLSRYANMINTGQNPGRLSFQDAQALRSEIGAMMGERGIGLNDIPRRELANVYRSLTADMRGTLQQYGGQQGVRAFDRATRHYNAGQRRFDKLEEVLGNSQSSENIATRIQNMGRTDSAGLYQLRRSMNPDEWRTISSGILRQMGEPTAGIADDLGEGFSPSRFLTNLNQVQKNRRGFQAMFGGTDMAQAMPHLRDLALVSDRLKTNAKLQNHSGSGLVNVLMGMIGIGTLGPMNAFGLVAGNNTFARAMVNPAFARMQLGAGRALSRATRQGGRAMESAANTWVPKMVGILKAHETPEDQEQEQ